MLSNLVHHNDNDNDADNFNSLVPHQPLSTIKQRPKFNLTHRKIV